MSLQLATTALIVLAPYCSSGAGVLLDGRIDYERGEWLDASELLLDGQGRGVRALVDDHAFYLAIQVGASGATGLELHVERGGKREVFHVSTARAQGEWTTAGPSYSDSAWYPPANAGWAANVVETLVRDGRVEPLPLRAFELEFALDRLAPPVRIAARWRTLTGDEVTLPASADLGNPEGWIRVVASRPPDQPRPTIPSTAAPLELRLPTGCKQHEAERPDGYDGFFPCGYERFVAVDSCRQGEVELFGFAIYTEESLRRALRWCALQTGFLVSDGCCEWRLPALDDYFTERAAFEEGFSYHGATPRGLAGRVFLHTGGVWKENGAEYVAFSGGQRIALFFRQRHEADYWPNGELAPDALLRLADQLAAEIEIVVVEPARSR